MLGTKIHPKSDSTDIAVFIGETFHRRECIRFFQADSAQKCNCKDSENNEEPTSSSEPDSSDGNANNLSNAKAVCKCGYSKTMHSNEAVGPATFYNISKSWNVEEDTKAFPTNAHGKIEFDDSEEYKPYNKSTVKRFIRLDYEVDPDEVVELFHKYWKMNNPELIISIISGGKRRDQNTKEKYTSIEWFCEKLVETATQTNAWIITEGITDGIGGIIGDEIEKILDVKGKRPKAVLSICNWGCVKDKHRLIKEEEQKTFLETQSICAKCDGRNRAEVYLDRNHTNFVLVDDGRQFHPGCEKIVRQKLELKLREYDTEKNDEDSPTKTSIPFIYFLIGGDDNDMESVERALANEIPVIVATGTGGEADNIVQMLVKQNKPEEATKEKTDRAKRLSKAHEEKLLVLFNTKTNDIAELSHSILNLLKDNKANPNHIFVLAADWDNKLFFRELLREKPKGTDLEEVMSKLLLKDNCSYVEVLLGSGVNLGGVMKRTQELELTDDIMKNEIVAYLLNQTTSSKQKLSPAETENKIGKLLCIWSVYRGKTEMAKVFWRQGKNYLAMALMAYEVSKDQKRKLKGKEECSAMKEQMKSFETLATSFLKICDEDNRQNTIALLRGQVPDLNNQTPMQIAFDGDFKEFVAQNAFQKLLDQIWTKRIIDYDKHKYIPLTVSIFCPLAAPTLFEYRYDEKHREDLIGHSPTLQSFLYFFMRVRSFLNAPVIKFIYNTLSYLAYLVLFSIVMLTDFRTTMSPSEILLTIWTFVLIIEECRQASIFHSEYLNKWNMIDIIAMSLYAIGFILRIIYQKIPSACFECLYNARIVLAFSLLLSVLRVIQLLSISTVIGPKIYMISGLLKDLLSFLLIIAIFISAYGIVSNVILYPNQPLNAKLLQDVFYDAWWSVFGQFNREDAFGDYCNMNTPSSNVSIEYCSSRTDPDVDYVACKESKCPADRWLVSVLLAFYALFTVVMMLNVLIAMFNVTFNKVEEKQNRVSKMQRYRLIREYHFRSKIPAPLCVFAYVMYIPWVCRLCQYCCCTEDEDNEKMDLPPLEPSKNLFSKLRQAILN